MALPSNEVLLATAVALVLSFWLYTLRKGSSLDSLPGPPPLSWLLGSYGSFLDGSSGELTDSWTAKYGRAFRYKGMLGSDRVYLSDPAAIDHVFVNHYDIYPKSPIARQRLARVVGAGLVWAGGEQHMRQRRIMSPSFIRARLRDQYHVFEAVSLRLRNAMRREIGDKPQATLNMNDILSRATMDIILEAALDYPCETLNHTELEIANVYRGFMLAAQGHQSTFFKVWNEYTPLLPMWLQRAVMRLPTARYSEIRRRMAITRGFAVEVVEAKIAQVERGEELVNDALGVMIRSNFAEKIHQRMSKDEIIEQVSTIVMAGHDTTAATLSWLLDLLADHQEWQDKLRAASWEFLQQYEKPTLDDYEAFPLLNAVLREGMRRHVVIPYLTRLTSQDDIIPLSHPIKTRDGMEITSIPIPANTFVDIGMIDYAKDKALWGDDAHEFNPERWLRPGGPIIAGAEETRGSWNHMLTFATGARMCIGYRFAALEMQMFLCQLICNFRFTKPPGVRDFFKPNIPIVQPFIHGKIQMPLLVETVKTPF